MKEKLIELFQKIGNETDTFAPFITCDEFENLADEIVKLCNLQNVSVSLPSSEDVVNACIKQVQDNGYRVIKVSNER